ncbi:MAG: glycosyltransferase [Victivallales bacterium]
MNLYLFTRSFPYDIAKEQSFLLKEIEVLKSYFDRIVIIPQETGGYKYELLKGVCLDESFANNLRQIKHSRRIILYFDIHALKELIYNPQIILNIKALKSLLYYNCVSNIAKKWVIDYIKREGLELDKSVFYTYWNDVTTLSLTYSKQLYPSICLVSRAHGIDLYEERHPCSYIPFRKSSILLIDAVFPDSEAGTGYLKRNYGNTIKICETARLGVCEPGFISLKSGINLFRIVSCSMVMPVKRVDLIKRSIQVVAKMKNNIMFEWHHLGEYEKHSQLLVNSDISNLKIKLHGYPSHEYLMEFYKNNTIDLFMNTSMTEGTPVSIMEAISCGIPCLATKVGGNPEIVNEANGILFDKYDHPEDIAGKIAYLVDNREVLESKRIACKNTWNEKYNADKNYSIFADRLLNIPRRISI